MSEIAPGAPLPRTPFTGRNRCVERLSEVAGGAIAGNGNIPNYCHPQERLDIRVVGLRFERIPEKDEKKELQCESQAAVQVMRRHKPRAAIGNFRIHRLGHLIP